MNISSAYCNNFYAYSRFPTCEVSIGDIPLGGNNPIRIQSMVSIDTMNTSEVVEQCKRLAIAGCEYIRLATPGIREAENLRNIRKILHEQGFRLPLIADVHFNPKVAEMAAQFVEKVRINPGNFAEKQKTVSYNISEKEYQNELEKTANKLHNLLNICKINGTAIRIGVNHGSLSPRILNRYGDTPKGMVESAMEFLRICRSENFHKLVVSMKSSNPLIMIQSYRLLVSNMIQEGMNYPLHLGVTEAGFGEEGRIKSAAGIGALLLDGLGDTIRVSLTEEPENEIPAAKKIIQYIGQQPITNQKNTDYFVNPFSFETRLEKKQSLIYNVFMPVIGQTQENPSADLLYDNERNSINNQEIVSAQKWLSANDEKKKEWHFIELFPEDFCNEFFLNALQPYPQQVLIAGKNTSSVKELRHLFQSLHDKNLRNPVILHLVYQETDQEAFCLQSAMDASLLLCDGLGEGLWLENFSGKLRQTQKTAFTILQACKRRITSTEFISCPSCGRTKFDIQAAVKKVQEKTQHLTGLKIAVMGCIVNGPGEMADADYGYVGAGKGKVWLYRKKEAVCKNIPEEIAIEKLIELIYTNGDWKEPGNYTDNAF